MKIKATSFFSAQGGPATGWFYTLFIIIITAIFILPNFAQALIPSDSGYSEQWYLEKIGAPEAWDIKKDSPQAVIAILDTGVDIDHPDLRDNIWKNRDEIADNGIDDDKNGYIDDVNGWDFVNNVSDPNPKFQEGFTDIGINHGTIVAGIAAAKGNNAFAAAGVSWQAQLMPLKVLDDAGEGKISNVIKAIDYAINNKADIINFSFVGLGYDDSVEEVIKRAYNAGIIIVAAAGNEDSNGASHSLDETKVYPICYDGADNMVIGVAATDALDQKAEFSNYGFDCIDIAAPGTSYLNLVVYEPDKYYKNKYFNKYYEGYWSGTSMAAPLVSGSLALIKAANPKLSREETLDIMYANAKNISRLNPNLLGQLGRGRIDLAASLKKVEELLNKNQGYIMTAPQAKAISAVRVFSGNATTTAFNAYSDNFTGGASIAAGDIDGDGIEEIITGAGPGGGPHVRIFDQAGSLKSQFFAYADSFRGGVNVASGDIDGDGIEEIITGVGAGGGPHVRIFDQAGTLKGQFFAYDKNFRGGVNVAAGDINQDGIEEIISGVGAGGGPHVRIFDQAGSLKSQFFAYAENFRGGLNVAAGDIDGDGIDDIIAGAGPGGGPHVRIFDQAGSLKGQFFAYDKNFRGGVNVASGDLNQDGIDEIITGAGPSGGPHARSFDQRGNIIESFFAYEPDFLGGVKVGVVRVES